jgi:hypothetical protein
LECRCFTLGMPIQKIGRKILITIGKTHQNLG